jgi:hypothetical protein
MIQFLLEKSRSCRFSMKLSVVTALFLMNATGALLRADLTPIGYISIDTAVPIGGIDTIGVGNLTGETYGCSVPAGFQVCTDITISGSVTFQFQDGNTVDTLIVPLSASLGPGLYDPTEFQFLDSATLLSATFTGTISATDLDLVFADNSIAAYTASPDIVSSPLTPLQPLALLQVDVAPVPMPDGPDFTLAFVALGMIGFSLRHHMQALGRWLRHSHRQS